MATHLKIKIVVTLLCILPFCNKECLAQIEIKNDKIVFPKKTYHKKSLGENLQQLFFDQCASCKIVQTATRDGNKDYIPNDIMSITALDFNTPVENINVSSNGLFTYIFSGSEITDTLDKKSFIMQPGHNIASLNLPITYYLLSPHRYPAFVYTINCSNLLSATASLSLKVPWATAKSAIEADQNRTSSIFAYGGFFTSPMKSEVLEKHSPLTTKVLMTLWEFYFSNPNYKNNAYYLNQFHGVTVGRTLKSDQYRNIELNIGLEGKNPLISGGLSTADTARLKAAFQGVNYQTLILQEFNDSYKREHMFSPLPNVKDIFDYFLKSPRIANPDPNGFYMSKGTEHISYVDIDGIAPSNHWRITDLTKDIYKDNILNLTVEQVPENHNITRFTFKGIPNENQFLQAMEDRNISLSFNLTFDRKIGDTVIKIPIQATFGTTLHPTPDLSNLGPLMYTSGPSPTPEILKLSWTTAINFNDLKNKVDYSGKRLVKSLGKGCIIQFGSQNFPASAFLTFLPNNTCNLTISLSGMSSIEFDSVNKSSKIANFSGIFDIPVNANNPVTKPININLVLPDTK
jgi:hypothetical protein